MTAGPCEGLLLYSKVVPARMIRHPPVPNSGELMKRGMNYRQNPSMGSHLSRFTQQLALHSSIFWTKKRPMIFGSQASCLSNFPKKLNAILTCAVEPSAPKDEYRHPPKCLCAPPWNGFCGEGGFGAGDAVLCVNRYEKGEPMRIPLAFVACSPPIGRLGVCVQCGTRI